MFHPVLDFRPLRVIKAVECSNQITCDPANPLELDGLKLVLYLDVVAINRQSNLGKNLFRVPLLQKFDLCIDFLLSQVIGVDDLHFLTSLWSL